MKTKSFITLSLIFLFSITAFSQSEEDGWVKLANKTAAFKPDTDHISMLGKKQNLDKIKITCTQGTLKIKKVRVNLSDGSTKEYIPKGTGVLTKGLSTFAYKIPGDDLKVKGIEIDYDSVGALLITKKGKIEIWGKPREKN